MQEIIDIVDGVADTMMKRMKDEAIIIPKITRAALEFYQWLVVHDRFDNDEVMSRDVVEGIMLAEMKKRTEY